MAEWQFAVTMSTRGRPGAHTGGCTLRAFGIGVTRRLGAHAGPRVSGSAPSHAPPLRRRRSRPQTPLPLPSKPRRAVGHRRAGRCAHRRCPDPRPDRCCPHHCLPSLAVRSSLAARFRINLFQASQIFCSLFISNSTCVPKCAQAGIPDPQRGTVLGDLRAERVRPFRRALISGLQWQ